MAGSSDVPKHSAAISRMQPGFALPEASFQDTAKECADAPFQNQNASLESSPSSDGRKETASVRSRRLWKQSFDMCLPVIASYIFVGIAYGLVMHAAGFGWFWPLVSSLFLYTGAFQFVLCALVSGGTSLAAILISGLLLNSRQSFYALTFVHDFNTMKSAKPFMIHTLTDETYALGCTLLDHPDRKELMLRNHIICWLTWSGATLVGALSGELLPFSSEGLDFCLTALFVTIFISQWKSTAHHTPALSGLILGILCLLLFGPDRFMLPTLILVSAFLLLEPWLRRRLGPAPLSSKTKAKEKPERMEETR